MYDPHILRLYGIPTNHVQILVPSDREAEARELLMPLLNPEPERGNPGQSR